MTISGTSVFTGERPTRSRHNYEPQQRSGMVIVSYPDNTPDEERFPARSRFSVTEVRSMVKERALPVGTTLLSWTGITYRVSPWGHGTLKLVRL